MNDMNVFMRYIYRSAMLFVSGCLLVWALFPDLKPIAAGLVLGTLISLINARILGYKIHKLTEVALANSRKRGNTGLIGRISMVLIGTMTSLRFPQFDLYATVIGFFFVQAASLVLGFLLNARLHKGKR